MSKLLVMEHKTSSEDIGPGSVYWRKLTLDAQVSGYLVGARALGHEPDGVLYDVLRKPALLPLKATPLDSRKYTKPTAKDPVSRLYANQRETDETVEEYRDRCMADIAENPDHYYQRGIVVRMEDEERDAAFDAWHIGEQIRESRNANRWPRNVDACSQYNRMCDFWEACAGEASIDDPIRFRVDGAHRELAADGKRRLPLLTASSARAYRSCARKYFFAYERGIAAVKQAGALYFGQKIHKALETWLTTDRDLDAALAAMRDGRPYDVDDAKAEAMIRGYHARWCAEAFDVVAVEKEFRADLVNPATGAKSRTWERAGKIDALIRV